MSLQSIRRVGVLTAGGDCPGLNAVIRAVAKSLMLKANVEVIGIEDGFEGLIQNRMRKLSYEDVSGILQRGGTILGTSNKADPFAQATVIGNEVVKEDVSAQTIAHIDEWQLDALVCIGGDGSMSISRKLVEKGVPVVGVPKTIDNDLYGTDVTFGFDTAVSIAADAIDRIHTTAQSHHRVMLVEIMGRYAGWLTISAGIAGGADVIILPEMEYDLNYICERVVERSRYGKRFSIVAVSEGAKPKGGEVVVSRVVKDSHESIRLGGVSIKLGNDIEDLTGLETRATVLGHLQRGGPPTANDRILATRFGVGAATLVASGQFNRMVALRGTEIVSVPITEVGGRSRTVPADCPLLDVAESVGTALGAKR
ncbi:MAG TPA: ATP-dependent 6-phosphofructokinase [bacterium]|nr:ATP-dependent 6-phosphofructokinase [bacterium]HPR87012.1 ATP-dependent 6-phosphofructokinase [bacterium]